MLGWGLSILLNVTPHEDPYVGGGLAAFGLALLATAPRLPEFHALTPAVPALLGGGALAAVLGHTLASGSRLDVPKAVILALGAALVASAPLLGRRVPVGRGRTVTVATLAVGALAVLGAPLAVWGLQALSEGLVGTSPVEVFVRFALLVPLGAFLEALGFDPAIDGQKVAYATPSGPLVVEVGAACSGVQAMALFTGVLALFLLHERPTGRRLAAWSAIGLLGCYAANLARLAALTLVGYQWGPAALLRAHAQAGWVFFVAWALLFAWLAKRSGRVAATPERPGGDLNPSRNRDRVP